MAQLQENNSYNKGKRKAKKLSTRIDMTPMVDLAFLLLTFFVLTATFAKPKSMELGFPAPDGNPVPIKNGITFLLSRENRIFYYEGEFRPETTKQGEKTKLVELNFSEKEKNSLRNYLHQKNKILQDKIKILNSQHKNRQLNDTLFRHLVMQQQRDKTAFTYLIKTDNHATYKNVIDVIDELNVNVVGKYVMADLMKPELELINEQIAFK